MSGLTLKETLAGTAIGIMIAIGYGTQTIGLQSILSSESAFLTALYVPLVPILMWVIFQKSPSLMTWIGSALAFTGLVLLTGNGFPISV
jgi:drug/metabolite transporter (DMT)-like permease